MSVRLEYIRTNDAYVEYLPEADIGAAEAPGPRRVLLISYDEGLVFTGTPEELVALANRMIAAVSRAEPGPGPDPLLEAAGTGEVTTGQAVIR